MGPLHPRDASITQGADGEEWTIYPAELLPINEPRVCGAHTVRRFTQHYGCSCPAWRFHADPNVQRRSCEHIAQVVGEEYERVRLKASAESTPAAFLPQTPTKRGSASTARQRLGQFLSPDSSPSKRQRVTPPTTRSPSRSPSQSASASSAREQLISGGSEPITVHANGAARYTMGYMDGKVNFMLATHWPGGPGSVKKEPADPTGWWVSEKLPQDMPLDGELWIGRGLFEHTSSVCRTTTSDEWHHVKYMVFDTPGWPQEPVEQRWDRIRAVLSSAHGDDWRSLEAGPYLVEHTRCMGQAHLDFMLDHVLEREGEGVHLCKLKPVLDAEARVVGYEDGQNNAAGLVGSLVCETLTPPIVRFRVGSGLTEALRQHPPSLGTVITYQYGGIGSQGLPRFPRFHGIRADP